MSQVDKQNAAKVLLESIKVDLPALEELLAEMNSEWVADDMFYRFYHHSFKVYGLQSVTDKAFGALGRLLPGVRMNQQFLDIVHNGTGKTFEMSDNRRWGYETRPILEAFWHVRQMVDIAVRCGKTMDTAPDLLPSGWAALLYLYNLR